MFLLTWKERKIYYFIFIYVIPTNNELCLIKLNFRIEQIKLLVLHTTIDTSKPAQLTIDNYSSMKTTKIHFYIKFALKQNTEAPEELQLPY